MKQVLQDIRSGAIAVHEVPEPTPQEGYVLVAVGHSLISAGTERASASLGAKSLLAKARARPDLVRKVVDTARAEGIGTAVEKVRTRLDQLTSFGYSAAGTVLDTGGDPRLSPGMPVACVGAGYASHAEVVSVPANLVVPIPDGVTTAEAAFAAPAAIALHALRLAEAGPGSVVGIVGLGLIGQIAGRIVEASGSTAVGTDPRDDRRGAFGLAADAATVEQLMATASRGRGADAVLVTAATQSDAPVQLAAGLSRDRGRVIVVGDVGLVLDRRVFYERELSLVVARSYGPGRYDRDYEEGGHDLPVGHVRWTEGRNVEAVLDLLASGRLRLNDLVTHRFPVDRGEEAFETLTGDASALGILLEYEPPVERRRTLEVTPSPPVAGTVRVALIGAGAFARGTLVPALQSIPDVGLAAVVARTGASAKSLADRTGAATASTDAHDVIGRSDIDAVVIATPHSEHAELAAAALRAGKAVFVEKPLAIEPAGLAEVADAARAAGRPFLVGHNRRFAPLLGRARAALDGPLLITIRVAAGPLPAGSWLADPAQGGRVLGEISHFVDLAAALVGAPPFAAYASTVAAGADAESLLGSLRFADGSAASIAYGVGESPGLPKERIEVFAANAAVVIDDFARLTVHAQRSSKVKENRDKGHRQQLAAWIAAIRGEAPLPVSVEEQLLVAAASLALFESARTGSPVDVALPA